MYETAPPTKIDGVRRWGATPVLLPRDKVLEWLNTQAWKSEPETFIHPFADPTVMAGHGGIGLELLEDIPDLARVVIPVGGGGLVSRIASAVKAIKPGAEVVRVQSGGYPSWTTWLKAGGPAPIN